MHIASRWRKSTSVARRPRRLLNALDRSVARLSGRRKMLFHVRTAMHAAVLDPMARAIECDSRIAVRYLAESPRQQEEISRRCPPSRHWISAEVARWTRIDLLVTADPWDPPTLLRCQRRINFFHGVAGKYNLDDPSHLPIGLADYDRVAFVNADRMQRYLAKQIVTAGQAALVGFPRNRRARQRRLRRRRDPHRPRARAAAADGDLRADLVAARLPCTSPARRLSPAWWPPGGT